MKTLLYVEDERTILANVRRTLSENGYRVLAAEDLSQARAHLSSETPDAIILDIMLPDGNGLDLLNELREQGSRIPVIMLTAWGEPNDVERGLNLGANDYMSKPFTYGVLLARVKAMFRNVEQMPEKIMKGEITLRVRPMEVHFDGKRIKLPPVEFYLLQYLMENEGRTLRAEHLYRKVWGAEMNEDPNSVKNTVSRLRKKLDESGCTISAVRGEGYRFERKGKSE